MISFGLVWAWIALPLPWLIWRFMPAAPRVDVAALKVPFFTEAAQAANTSNMRKIPKSILFLSMLAWLLLVAAAAKPQWLSDAVALPLSGRDLMLAIDVSGSMEIPDFALNGQPATRLEVIKEVASRFIELRAGDRLGLIIFGSRAYLQTPLTFDRKTVVAMINDAEIGLAGKETAIGDAIGLAVKKLRLQPSSSRILILLTDGANTAGAVEPMQAARLAAQEGLRIYTIGVGADEMRIRVPNFFGTQMINPSSQLDEKLLQAIANTTKGTYFRARDTAGLEEIYEQLNQIEPTSHDSEYFRPVIDLYYWPLAAALICSIFVVLLQTGIRFRSWRRNNSVPNPKHSLI